ncbi:hypothetical protein RZS08_62065, partial [Arthrospira platensis SPKY1]|nr:hypothetical protein [Arthrospira platensis SPKY1]
QNQKHLHGVHGGYEWWYMDFMDPTSGLSGVIIFYNGNLFSPAYIRRQKKRPETAYPEAFPALSISLYRHHKPVYYSFLEYRERDAAYVELSDGFRYQVGKDWISWKSDT